MGARVQAVIMLIISAVVFGEVFRVPVQLKTVTLNNGTTIQEDDWGLKGIFPSRPKVQQLKKTRDYLVGAITVGVPGRNQEWESKPYRVVLDTGSSTTWLFGYEATSMVLRGDKKHHFFGRVGTSTGHTFTTTYDNGATYTGTFACANFKLGGVTSFGGFGVVKNVDKEALRAGTEFDGYMGLGLDADPNIEDFMKSPFYNMIHEKKVSQNLFSVYIAPGGKGGGFLFGGIDENRFVTPLNRVPLSSNQGDWMVAVPEIRIGSTRMFTENVNAVIDTGVKNIFMPPGSMDVLVNTLVVKHKELSSSDFKRSGRKVWINCDRIDVLELLPIDFVIGMTVYGLDQDDYFRRVVWRKREVCILAFEETIFQDGGVWNLGLPFLQKYYTVFDAEKKEIGFALSKKAAERKVKNQKKRQQMMRWS